MTDNTLFDCQQMFRHACAFAECADMAGQIFCHETADIEWYTTPAIVNSAFACEVYLKAMLLYYDCGAERKHKIKELYSLLPDETKEWIRQTVINNYGGRWEDAFGRELLENISDSFVKWRYSYEAVSSLQVDIGFLTIFRNTLREACCQLFFSKTWDEYQTQLAL